VNHALLLSDLKADGKVLPPYDHVVIDEAHHLEDVATDQLGWSLTQAAMQHYLDEIWLTGGARIVTGLLSELPNYWTGSAATPGDLDRAEACYREVLAIQRTERNQQAIAHTLVNLGNLHISAGHPDKARPYYLEALDLLRTLNDDRALGILYNNLALQEAREEQWEQAVTSFKQALDHHRVVGNEEGLAVTYSQLGKCFLDQGDLTKAERCLNNASEHYIKLGNEPAEAAVLRLLATLYDTRQDRISARRCLERVVSLDLRYQLPELQTDSVSLAKLK